MQNVGTAPKAKASNGNESIGQWPGEEERKETNSTTIDMGGDRQQPDSCGLPELNVRRCTLCKSPDLAQGR